MIDKIKKHVSIADISSKFDIPLEEVCVGNFTHRCKCPSKNHKSGSERTGSCYIDANKNNFYCFGCQAGSSSIDFYMICTDLSFPDAVDCLTPLVADIKDFERKRVYSNYSILLEISDMFKEKIEESPFSIDQIKSVMRQTDVYISSIKTSEVKKTMALRAKVSKKLREI